MGWNDDVITKFRESKGTENYWGPKLVILHAIGAKSGQTQDDEQYARHDCAEE